MPRGTVVHAHGRVRARRPRRRAHRLGAERRLARRRAERRRRASRCSGASPRRGNRPSLSGSSTGPTRRAPASGAACSDRAPPQARWPTRTSCGSSRIATATRFRTRSPRTASTSTARSTRARELETAAAYLELHIEQGPVLESLGLPLGVVQGTFGVERHRITWHGQAAHAGSTPMDKRRDALAGAAKLALEIREIARRTGGGAVCTSGGVVCKPGIVTSVVETAEQLLDQRDLTRAGWRRCSRRRRRRASGSPPRSDRRRMGEDLVDRADPLRRHAARLLRGGGRRGHGHRASPSVRPAARRGRGRARGVPTVMMFVQSLRGLSHTKLEDTREEHLELAVAALDLLASKTIGWVSSARRRARRRRCAQSRLVAIPSEDRIQGDTHGSELRRHRPARPAVQPARRALPARRVARLRVRLDLRLARPLAGVVPAAHARRAGDDDDEVRPLRDEPRHARADRPRERLRDAARHLERPDGHGHRPRRLGAPLHRPEARPRRRVRASAAR